MVPILDRTRLKTEIPGVRDFENSRRHNSVAFEKVPMESRKRVTCSLVFPFTVKLLEFGHLLLWRELLYGYFLE